jgi:hypothetical protein
MVFKLLCRNLFRRRGPGTMVFRYFRWSQGTGRGPDFPAGEVNHFLQSLVKTQTVVYSSENGKEE